MFSAITISLRIANWLNWFFGALLMVTLSAIVGDWAGLGTMVFTHIEPASTHNAIRGYLFAMVVMMPPVMVAVHWILTRLAALARHLPATATVPVAHPCTLALRGLAEAVTYFRLYTLY